MKTSLQSIVIWSQDELHESMFTVLTAKETDYSHVREKAWKLKTLKPHHY